MKRQYILLLTALVVTPLSAANFGLVLGGVSNGTSSDQEFTRLTALVSKGLESHGYQVKVLFGDDRTEAKNFETDYHYLKQRGVLHPKSEATQANLDASLGALLKDAKNGDHVDIFIAAHGKQDCGKRKSVVYSYDTIVTSRWCVHYLSLSDGKGGTKDYRSDKLVQFLEKLENKGVVANLVFSSEHSGRVKRFATKLRTSCLFTASSGAGNNTLCAGDSTDDESPTGTIEMLALHYYADLLPLIRNDGYLKKNSCFQAILSNYQANKNRLDLTSLASSYWSGRRFDLTYQEPSLSTLAKYSYFNRDHFNEALGHDSPRSYDKVNWNTMFMDLVEALNKMDSVMGKDPSYLKKKELFRVAVGQYNQVLELQRQTLTQSLKDKNGFNAVSQAQETTGQYAKILIAAERDMIDVARKVFFKEKDTPCDRTF